MAKREKRVELRVDHGPIDDDVIDSLTPEEKAWLRSWNRASEIPEESDDTDDEDDADDEGNPSYDDMTNDELRAELDERGLPTSGNKAELIERLTEDDDSEE